MTKLHLLFCLLLFISFTNSQLTAKEQDNLQTMADVQKIATDSFRLTAMIINFFHFNKVGALWYTYQIKLLQYPRYLEISYPDRAAFMLAQSDYDLFTVPDISQPPDKVIEKATYYTVPIQFLAFGNLSNFLINFWLYMMILAIILVGIVIAIVLDFCTKPSKALHPIFAKLNQALKWNYLIAIFIGNFSDIALWTSLNMKTVEFANYFEWISFFECIFVNIGVIAVIVRLAFIVNRLRREKAEAVKTGSSWQLDLYKQNMKEYTMVFDDFKDESLLQQSYILVFMVKLYIFYVIIAYLYKYPFAQTIIINIIGIANLVYLAFVRPFKGKIDLISVILQESILELMNLCVFALALADEKGYIIADFRTTMGDIIIGCNMAFMFLGAIYLLILALFVLKDIYTWMAKECCDHKVAPYNINIIPAEKSQQNTKTEPNSSYSANESNLYLNRPTRPTKSSKPERKVRLDPGVNVSQYEQRETFGGYENDRSFENHEYYQSKYQEQEPEPILHNPFVKDPYENKLNQGSREKIYYVEDPSGVFNDVLRLSPLDLANSNIGADYRLNVGSPKNKDDEYQLEPVWKKKNPFGSQSKQNLFS